VHPRAPLKGSAANVGAALIANAAREIEWLASANDLVGAEAGLARLSEAVDLTRAALGRTPA
jgi:HPt (histidine-containing phosphotransfer) domain-containing protein